MPCKTWVLIIGSFNQVDFKNKKNDSMFLQKKSGIFFFFFFKEKEVQWGSLSFITLHFLTAMDE